MFCNKPPWWLHRSVYLVLNCLFLGPLYRVIYWSTVRVVKLHFKKTFNTEENDTSIPTWPTNYPYKNYVQNFNLNTKSEQDKPTLTKVSVQHSQPLTDSIKSLLAGANDEDPCLFVALYDFHAGSENQLSLQKTEQLRILSYNMSGEWCEAHNAYGMCVN